MTDDEIRIAIAELCGWQYELIPTCQEHSTIPLRMWSNRNFPYKITEPPDYPGNLNAMREARRLINTTKLRVKYLTALREIVGRRCPKNKFDSPIVSDYDLLDASADEHAETFLRVFGKWKV